MTVTSPICERETVIYMRADDRGHITAYSNDPPLMRKFERAGAVVERTESDGGRHYSNVHISIRKPRDAAQRRAVAQRLQTA
jgi:hypothetical protein